VVYWVLLANWLVAPQFYSCSILTSFQLSGLGLGGLLDNLLGGLGLKGILNGLGLGSITGALTGKK
jgi:hypothetical protein